MVVELACNLIPLRVQPGRVHAGTHARFPDVDRFRRAVAHCIVHVFLALRLRVRSDAFVLDLLSALAARTGTFRTAGLPAVQIKSHALIRRVSPCTGQCGDLLEMTFRVA